MAKKPSREPSGWDLIAQARRADPAGFKFAILVAGLLALIATIAQLGVSVLTLAVGAVAFLVLMTLYVIFKVIPPLIRGGGLKRQAAVLSWASLASFVAVLVLLLTSAFCNRPLPLKDWIILQITPSEPSEPADRSPAPRAAHTVEESATSAQESILADRRTLLAREIQARKAKCINLLRFLDRYSSDPSAYRIEGSKIHGPPAANGITSLELDSRHLPSVQEISRLSRDAGLDKDTERLVSVFKEAYERFVTSVDDPTNKQYINVGVYNWRKFAQGVTMSANFALCALDAELGETAPGSGPVPLGCTAVYK